VQPWKLSRNGAIDMNKVQADWVRCLMATNRSGPILGIVRGQTKFDSRRWLKEIKIPTFVVAGTHDAAVPQYHFDTLVNGIPGACGQMIERAGHALIWTHTREFADIIRTHLQTGPRPRNFQGM
jgi:pimeloyl-ACP methyl ester carboxylesterase